MKTIVNISRIIVGVLFIFSGLIKANDPLGLSYKMQEFFEVWGKSFPSLHSLMLFLNDYALTFSIITITLEVIVGVAILLGWGVRFFSWLLLILIIFFTFLTGYAVLSGNIKECGCFGNCIPLTAMQSFIKDIILFVLILIILFGRKYIKPLAKGGVSVILVIVSVLLLLGFQWYVLRRLPVIDCLPLKTGNNLLELRKMPANAVADKVDFKFIYEKNGEKKEFNKNQLPDSTWTFLKREDIIIEKGKNNEPLIKDFFLTTLSGTDSTEAILNQPGEYYLFFIKDVAKDTADWLPTYRNLHKFAAQRTIPVYIIASGVSAAQKFFNEENDFNVTVLSIDAVALKTAARTDPALYLMKGPIVQKKWGSADIDKAAKELSEP
ncbi:MAG: DoxX family protein [Chitinophagaceae bacterium]|nr:DoxX family protein [Chitinophagaceae bacterium]